MASRRRARGKFYGTIVPIFTVCNRRCYNVAANEKAGSVFHQEVSMAYQIVGRAFPRLEGVDKVSGKTQYAADVSIPGLLLAKILRSPVPHARLLKVDTSRARQLPGVHAVITGADLPPVLVGLRMKDMPVLARDRVRYVGE